MLRLERSEKSDCAARVNAREDSANESDAAAVCSGDPLRERTASTGAAVLYADGRGDRLFGVPLTGGVFCGLRNLLPPLDPDAAHPLAF